MPRVSSRAKHVDLFGNVAWDATRIKVQQKADEWRRQGFIGATMASHAELRIQELWRPWRHSKKRFILRREQTVAAKA